MRILQTCPAAPSSCCACSPSTCLQPGAAFTTSLDQVSTSWLSISQVSGHGQGLACLLEGFYIRNKIIKQAVSCANSLGVCLPGLLPSTFSAGYGGAATHLADSQRTRAKRQASNQHHALGLELRHWTWCIRERNLLVCPPFPAAPGCIVCCCGAVPLLHRLAAQRTLIIPLALFISFCPRLSVHPAALRFVASELGLKSACCKK